MVGLQAGAAPGVGAGQARQGVGVRDRLVGHRRPPGGLLEVDARLGHPEPGVVGGDRDPGPPGIDLPVGREGAKIASEIRRNEVSLVTCAGPPAGTGPETLDPAAAVDPRESELLRTVWIWPRMFWTWPSWRIQLGPIERLGSQRTRACSSSARVWQTRSRARAISRSRAPASRKVPARSLGRIAWTGDRDHAVSIGRRGLDGGWRPGLCHDDLGDLALAEPVTIARLAAFPPATIPQDAPSFPWLRTVAGMASMPGCSSTITVA